MTAASRRPAGDLVGGIAPLCLEEGPTLPVKLVSRAEQVDYGNEVEEALQHLPCPSLLEERKAVGFTLRKRVLRVLEQLAIRGHGQYGGDTLAVVTAAGARQILRAAAGLGQSNRSDPGRIAALSC